MGWQNCYVEGWKGEIAMREKCDCGSDMFLVEIRDCKVTIRCVRCRKEKYLDCTWKTF